ncbi:N-acetyltransferase [Ancylobacter sp. 6x-1]|uniref:N-acetyltransferase n=1 Tax=Ancylobacter crimeensis TaxID=2579147 RepID=A0ABT0D7X7_9HYPH|nr:N-acetyltransferase [Ancylobacter crimeensis]MCK0196063.1 N-acetyltransferase [Ancylobacter crimeensis]
MPAIAALPLTIAPEAPDDGPAIHRLTRDAFATAPHRSGTEAAIVDALRAADALTLSLVARESDALVGHVAFSPVAPESGGAGWYGLGPLSVRPDRQRSGIGTALVARGLALLRAAGAQGCVVLGEPAYYGRFGFTCDPLLTFPGVPPGYFQRVIFRGPAPTGAVAFHAAFGAG